MKADKRPLVYTAAAMYGGATFIGLVEGLIPGGPELALIPGLAALVFVTLLLLRTVVLGQALASTSPLKNSMSAS